MKSQVSITMFQLNIQTNDMTKCEHNTMKSQVSMFQLYVQTPVMTQQLNLIMPICKAVYTVIK